MKPYNKSPNDAYAKKLDDVSSKLGFKGDEFESMIQGLLKLGRLLIRFSEVKREGTLESDIEHTVMLAVVACAVAATWIPELDVGKVAQYALVHDLIEAYCGDISTSDFTAVDFGSKENKEEQARKTIKIEFGAFPWLHETIEQYEALNTPEARFIKTLDKAMPALIHNLNDGCLFEKEGPTKTQKSVRARSEWLRTQDYSHDQQLALLIREVLMERVIALLWKKIGQ